jgi:DNA-directed RNA polymerase sigma subunit (sigma70/sigma32)
VSQLPPLSGEERFLKALFGHQYQIRLEPQLAIDINRILSRITERKRMILIWFYGIGCQEQNRQQIAHFLGLSSPKKVRNIKNQTMTQLRNCKAAQNLRRFLVQQGFVL